MCLYVRHDYISASIRQRYHCNTTIWPILPIDRKWFNDWYHLNQYCLIAHSWFTTGLMLEYVWYLGMPGNKNPQDPRLAMKLPTVWLCTVVLEWLWFPWHGLSDPMSNVIAAYSSNLANMLPTDILSTIGNHNSLQHYEVLLAWSVTSRVVFIQYYRWLQPMSTVTDSFEILQVTIVRCVCG